MTTKIATLSMMALMLAGTAACTGKYKRPTTPDKITATPEMVARGGYVVNSVAACGFCHTPRAGGSWVAGERTDAALSGGMLFDDPGAGFKVSIPNITPDVETGIGTWSDDEIVRAIRDGIHKDNSLLWPPMLFYMYDQMSDDDVRAVVAYLRTVPPVRNKVERVREAGFMIRFLVNRGLLHHEPAKNVKAPPTTDKKAYGGYLARMGACVDCHSLTSMGPDLEDNLLGGSEMPLEDKEVGKVWARNLTPDVETGLGKYSAEQIKEALRNFKRLDGGPMRPPMMQWIPHTATLTDEDLDALVTYLKSVKPIKRKVPDPQLTPAAAKSIGL